MMRNSEAGSTQGWIPTARGQRRHEALQHVGRMMELGRQSTDALDRAAHGQGDVVPVVLLQLVLGDLKSKSLADRVEVDRDVAVVVWPKLDQEHGVKDLVIVTGV